MFFQNKCWRFVLSGVAAPAFSSHQRAKTDKVAPNQPAGGKGLSTSRATPQEASHTAQHGAGRTLSNQDAPERQQFVFNKLPFREDSHRDAGKEGQLHLNVESLEEGSYYFMVQQE